MINLEFQLRGACRDHDPELFFPVSETAVNAPQIAQAKAVCGDCPVRAECRAFALDTGQIGIWGGTTEGERRAIRARENRAVQARADQADTDQAGTEQGIGEDTPAESTPTLPSYESARQQLARARQHLVRVQQTSAAAITRAEQRLAAAQERFEAVRTRSTSGAVA